jgi:hypothetical protein
MSNEKRWPATSLHCCSGYTCLALFSRLPDESTVRLIQTAANQVEKPPSNAFADGPTHKAHRRGPYPCCAVFTPGATSLQCSGIELLLRFEVLHIEENVRRIVGCSVLGCNRALQFCRRPYPFSDRALMRLTAVVSGEYPLRLPVEQDHVRIGVV